MTAFARFAPRLQSAITSTLGWTALREVQEVAGQAILDGKNAIVLAPTAGGKTEAAMFPVLSELTREPPAGLAALYIAPIKALLNNQAERLGRYTEMVGLDRFVWHGDITSGERRRFLAQPRALLMTTPESLEVMLVSRSVPDEHLFADLRFVVIDEIHALAGTDRGAHLLSVIERLAARSRHDVQRVGLSATVGNPNEILHWLRGASRREGVVIDPPKAPSPKQLLVVYREHLATLARDAAQMGHGGKSLFFCQSRRTTEAVAERMAAHGIRVHVHHSAVSKEERARAEEQFHRGSDACIVCTSTLELGIDVGDLDRVLQAEAPSTVSAFMQRMGRTGRREGRAANTTFFCTSTESVLLAAALIQKARTGWVEPVSFTTRCWPVLVHQVLAMALAGDGIAPRAAWEHLSRLPDLGGVTEAEFRRLLRWMVDQAVLDEVGGRVVVGPTAERAFGRRNFMELFAVFSSPETYQVVESTSRVVGNVEQDFVDRLIDEYGSFLLGGRAWQVVEVDHDTRKVLVVPARTGREPSWAGFLPNFLSFPICQEMKTVLMADTELPWLHPTAKRALDDERRDLDRRGVTFEEQPCLEEDDDTVLWWTWAGGRINNTLKYALAAREPGWKVVSDNYRLRAHCEGLSRQAFRTRLDDLARPDCWKDDAFWSRVIADLPRYRLSKFQPFMPDWAAREMVSTFLLDLDGARTLLSGGSRPSRAEENARMGP